MESIKWISITDRYTKMYLDKKLEPLGLNSSQYMFVMKVCEEPGLSQEKLYSMFYLNPSNITRAITALEKQGFLVKRPNPSDKRTFFLDPTKKAKETYPKILEIVRSWYAKALQNFTEEEKETLERLAKQAGKNLLLLMQGEGKEDRINNQK